MNRRTHTGPSSTCKASRPPAPANALRLFDLGEFAGAYWRSYCSSSMQRACRPTANAALAAGRCASLNACKKLENLALPAFSSSLFLSHSFLPSRSLVLGSLRWKPDLESGQLEIEWNPLLACGSGTGVPQQPRRWGRLLARFGDHHLSPCPRTA
ncbi:hypothetical protein VTI28DRAFT_1228 [Corynascus sepedonium]